MTYEDVDTELAELSVNGVIYKGEFTDLRIDAHTVPFKHVYYLRHGDDDGEPATVENEPVVVNYFGLFMTDTEIPFGDKTHLDIDICSDGYSSFGYCTE